MNTELVNTLQSCIDTCDRLLQMTEEDKGRIQACVSSDLMKAYLDGCEKTEKGLKKIREQVLNLQAEAQLDLQQ